MEGLAQVALDLKMVNLDFYGLTNVAVAWASGAWRLGQYLQVHTFSHILSASTVVTLDIDRGCNSMAGYDTDLF